MIDLQKVCYAYEHEVALRYIDLHIENVVSHPWHALLRYSLKAKNSSRRAGSPAFRFAGLAGVECYLTSGQRDRRSPIL